MPVALDQQVTPIESCVLRGAKYAYLNCINRTDNGLNLRWFWLFSSLSGFVC